MRMNLKKLLATCILGTVTAFGAMAADTAIMPTSVAEAADYWCHNDGSHDYYVDSKNVRYVPEGYLTVSVSRSDNKGYEYRFKNEKGTWKYTYLFGQKGPNRSYGFKGYYPIDNQLANDILYVALQFT